jgi:outer membrane immunogenic protein
MGLQRYAAQTQQGVQVNKLLLASTALVALGLGTPAALAAEMALPAPAPVAAPVYTNWSGCHAGAVAGTTWGSSNRTAVVTKRPQDEGLPITGNFSLAGFTGGFDLGCDWQAGVWVFGVEGDWSADNKSGQAFALAPFNPLIVHETQERWVSTARGRLGWTWWNRSFVYVTGGGAWTKVDNSIWMSTNPISTKFIATDRLSGWVVGAGLEYALGYGWSARGEYLYEDFGTHSDAGGPRGSDNITTFRL